MIRPFLLEAEVVLYLIVALFLILISAVLLYSIGASFVRTLFEKGMAAEVVAVKVVRTLGNLLLVLMLAEILYTVRISITEHTLVPQPFLIVGLIAGIRRILVISAEIPRPEEIPTEVYHKILLEMGVLTLFILVTAISFFLLKK